MLTEYLPFPRTDMPTPDAFGQEDDTLDIPPPPTIVEGDLENVEAAPVGTAIRLYKVMPANGLPVSSVTKTVVARALHARHAPKGGVWKGQCMYYGVGGGQRTSLIDHIDRMSDGSYWLHTQNSVYRIELLDDVSDDTIFEAEVVQDADAEAGGTPVGEHRLQHRRGVDNLTGGAGDQ